MNMVEYGLLALFLGLLGGVVWQNITGDMGMAYGNWDTNTEFKSSKGCVAKLRHPGDASDQNRKTR